MNHLLMAQYFINIEFAKQQELHKDYQRRECQSFAVSVITGVLVGAAIHIGGAVLCDQVILPRCVDCCLANCGRSGCASCGCGGQVCLDHIPDLGYVTYAGTHTVADSFESIGWYRATNVFFCYLPGPLLCSLGAGSVIGCVMANTCCMPSGGDEYNSVGQKISRRLRSFQTNQCDVNDIAVHNAKLREAKRGKYVHMFLTASRPISVKMEEQQNNNIPQQMDAPAVLRME